MILYVLSNGGGEKSAAIYSLIKRNTLRTIYAWLVSFPVKKNKRYRKDGREFQHLIDTKRKAQNSNTSTNNNRVIQLVLLPRSVLPHSVTFHDY